MSFPLLQQREPFKKRWFALDPQERRLLYYKNPLVRATAGPSPVHPQTEVGSVLGGGGVGKRQGGRNLVRITPPPLLVSKSSPVHRAYLVHLQDVLCVSEMLPVWLDRLLLVLRLQGSLLTGA